MNLTLHSFFQEYYQQLYFIYGLVFFLMGFSIALQARAFRFSQFTMAGSLWLLAAFGLTHGSMEWGSIFIPLQAEKLAEGGVLLLRLWQMFLTGLSYYFLFLFGSRLLERARCRKSFLRFIPTIIFLIWFLNFILLSFFITYSNTDWWLSASDIWARYLLALPGSLLSSYALYKQIHEVEKLKMPHVTKNLILAAVSFIIYALAAGLIVPYAGFLPAAVVNAENFFRVTGIPVQVFRTVAGFLMAYSIIRTLEIFDLENRRRLEEAEKNQAVLQERTRISQDMHDTIIQSIYATGLNLENCLYLVGEDRDQARQSINDTMLRLDAIISDLRNYILDLKPFNAGRAGIVEGISTLTTEFAASSSLKVDLHFAGVPPAAVNPFYVRNLCQIIREALNNTLRYAKATEAKVQVRFQEHSACISITDNGIGFDPVKVQLVRGTDIKHGLYNMTERAAFCNGYCRINSRPGKGTTVTATIPYGVDEDGKDQGFNC